MSRGLFVELLGGIGDLVLSLPALEALAESDPERAWDVLTFAPGSELIQNDPRVARVHVAPRSRPSAPESLRPTVEDSDNHPPCWYALDDLLTHQDYELVVSDTRHSRLHERIESSNARQTATSLWRGAHPGEPISQTFLRRLEESGLVTPGNRDRLPIIYLSPTDRAAADQVWASLEINPRHAVVLNPASGMTIKRWPISSFRSVAQSLGSDGWNVVVVEGDSPEDALAIASADPMVQVLPRLPLKLTAACLADVAMFGSADTGLAHVAGAVGAPVVAVYGPTWAGRYGVQGIARNLQSTVDCPELNPMNFTLQRCWSTGRCIFPDRATCCDDVTTTDFLTAARAILSASGGSGGAR